MIITKITFDSPEKCNHSVTGNRNPLDCYTRGLLSGYPENKDLDSILGESPGRPAQRITGMTR